MAKKYKKIRRYWPIPAFLLFFLLVRFVAEIGFDRSPEGRFNVVEIIDGDTVVLTGGERLRLTAIDCPEKGEPFYDSAAAFVASAALGKNGSVVFGDRRRDGYGRLLGFLYFDSISVNEELIRHGLAHVYLFRDNIGNPLVERLLILQKAAIENGRGIWALEMKSEPYYAAIRGAYRFHRPGCSSVRNLPPGQVIKYHSRKEAFFDGLSPCRNCRP